MTKMHKRVAVACVGLVAGAALTHHFFGKPGAVPSAAVKRQAAPKQSNPGPRQADAVHRCTIEPAEQLRFSLAHETTAEIDDESLKAVYGGSLHATTRDARQSFEGTLEIEALAKTERGAVLLARFVSTQTSGAFSQRALVSPFLFELDARCQIVGFARHRETDKASARVVQALLHEMQWAAPNAGNETIAGENGVGHYHASYTLNGSLLTRDRLVYDRLYVASRAQGSAHAPASGTMNVTLSGVWFSQLRSHEERRGMMQFDNTTTHRAERLAGSQAQLADASRNMKDYVWENLLPQAQSMHATAQKPMDDAERKVLQQVPLEQAVTDFVDRVNQRGNIADTWPALARYLEANPTAIEPFTQKLVSGGLPEQAQPLSFVALSHASVPEARQALMGVLNNAQLPTIQRSRGAFALVSREDVGVELAQTLASHSSGLESAGTHEQRMFSRESTLALGMMAGLRPDGAEDIHDIARATTRQLLSSSNYHTLRPALAAIGNMGDRALLDEVAHFRRHQEPRVREATAMVFRRLKPVESESFVRDWLGLERSPEVRRKIFDVLDKQSFDSGLPARASVIAFAQREIAAKQMPALPTRQSIVNLLVFALERAQADSSQTLDERSIRRTLAMQLRKEIEAGSGLDSAIARHLNDEEIDEAMAGYRAKELGNASNMQGVQQ